MSNLAKQTPKQRAQFGYMADVIQRLDWDLHNTIEMTGHIPEEWHEIAARRPRRPGIKVNLRLDADVVKFFKSMGEGYGPRISDVLKSYMYARLAGVIKGADTINHNKVREDRHTGPKPRFGDMARRIGEPWEDLPDGPDEAKARAVEYFQRHFAEDGMPPEGTIRVK